MTTSAQGQPVPQRRNLVTEIPGPKSVEILERKKRAVAASIGNSMPIVADRASEGVIVDVDGNSFIDLGAGIAVTSVGASNPRVVEAVKGQVEKFTHTAFMVTPYESYVEVAERLNAMTPGDFEKRSALFNSGAEAVENAIKIARRATGRQAVVAFENAFHGRTNLTMALTAKQSPYKAGFGPFAPEVYRVPASYPYRDGGLTGPEAARRSIQAIQTHVNPESVAAVILEPIQGEGGFIEPAEGFIPAIREWCDENGVVFIADEIQTGFARTGNMFAMEREGVAADLVTTAKGIAGGLPLSAVTGRAELMDASQPGGLGGTYSGSPLSTAAALAAFDAFEQDGLVERANHIGEILRKRLEEMQAKDARIGEVRGRGAMIAMELVDPETQEPDAKLASAIASFGHYRGVLLLTSGIYDNVIRFLPPLTISDDLLNEGLDVVAEGLAAN